jgi:hypothetical protein
VQLGMRVRVLPVAHAGPAQAFWTCVLQKVRARWHAALGSAYELPVDRQFSFHYN